MSKMLKFNTEAREQLIIGADILASAVKVTLGPKGRNVVIDRPFGSPRITKDGVTVAREVSLPDKYQNMGAQLLKEVASKTNDSAGDGTTTATVLAQSILREGCKAVAAGLNPMDVKRGIDSAVKAAVDSIQSQSRAVTSQAEIAQIGTISANGDREIGEKIAEAMEKVGKEGIITVEEGKGIDFEVEVVEGMKLDRGYISPHFITEGRRMSAELEDVYVMIYEKKLSGIKNITSLLEAVIQSGKGLLVIAEDVEGEALATMVINKLRGVFKCVAVKTPGFGDRRKDILSDLAVLTGGQVINEELGMDNQNIPLHLLGRAGKVSITKDETTIVKGHGKKEDIETRREQLRAEIEHCAVDYDKEKLQERLAKLTGGVAVLRVGGASEVEVKERKDRVEDAKCATQAAAKDGIVPGGGVTLLFATRALDNLKAANADEAAGINIIRRALQAPIRQIAENAGIDGAVVVGKIMEQESSTYGYNAADLKYGDMIEFGVIDPTRVVIQALQNAASVSGLMITTESIITDKPEDNNQQNGQGKR
jgi:chaperonin GroEL